MINPVGIQGGWEEIQEAYTHIFSGPGSAQVEFYDYSIHADGQLCYVVGRERGEFRKEGTCIPLAARATNVFQWIDGRW